MYQEVDGNLLSKDIKKIAVIPWDEAIKQDNIFMPKTEGQIDSHILLFQEFEKQSIEFHTIDYYKDLKEVDCFLFFAMNYKWYLKVARNRLLDRTIYCSAEPPVVVPENTAEGYKKLLDLFGSILTWNYELVDDKRIFRRNIPYYFVPKFGNIAFSNRKLITSISGNKSSQCRDELYSKREEVINWFEVNHPGEFDFYGTGWEKEKHSCYKGVVDDKSLVYHQYRFAICFENMRNIKGYVTEKICDCLVSGIVPIYWGADDVELYIPKTCFIGYSSFNSIEQLYSYLSNMSEQEYNSYLDAAQTFINTSDKNMFSAKILCEQMLFAMKNHEDIRITLGIADWFSIYANYLYSVWDKLFLKIRIKGSEFRRKLRKSR